MDDELKLVQCVQCKLAFAKPNQYQRHYLTVHDKRTDEEVQASHPTLTLTSEYTRKQIFKEDNGDNKKNAQKQPAMSAFLFDFCEYVCLICRKRFKKVESIPEALFDCSRQAYR